MLRIDIDLIFTVINVLVLCAAVRIFLWKPIHKILDERAAMVEQSFAEAEQAKQQAYALLAEQSATKDAFELEKAAAMSDTRQKAREESERIVAAARERADAIVRQAENDATRRKDEIMEQSQGEIREIIIAATAKMVGAQTDAQSDLYDAFLEKAGGANE